MKKILGILVLGLLLSSNVYGEKIETFCLIKLNDLAKLNLGKEDQSRFAGKEIHFIINFDENIIMDISEDREVSIITGMYSPEDKLEFTNNNNTIIYKNEIVVNGYKEGETHTYSYVNLINISNKKPINLISSIDQKGITFNKWNFKINCRDHKHSSSEKQKAFSGVDYFENLKKKIEEIKKKKL